MGRGRRRTPSPRQGARDSPEALRRQAGPNGDPRARERNRNVDSPAWEQRPGSPAGAGGRWGSAGRRREDRESSGGRERRSSGRDDRLERQRGPGGWSPPSREQAVERSNGAGVRLGRTRRRGRRRYSPTRNQGGWGSPAREARQEHFGSPMRHAREQGPLNPDEVGSKFRERNHQNRSRAEGSWDSLKREQQNPDGEARGQDRPMRNRGGVEEPEGGGAGRDSPGRGGERKGTCAAAESGRPEASAALTDMISAVPKEWTPCEPAVHWWMQCRSTLQNHKMREQLMSICPRPLLPDRSSETPQVNPDILSLLNRNQEKELRSATHFSRTLQDEVLDMLAPAMTIYEMAEEAMEKGEPVDPMELREWSRHLIRFIGSINHRLTTHRRVHVLGSINPRLKVVVSKMSGQSTEGMLFSEDKVKLLKEIIMRFPQLAETKKTVPWKRFQPSFNQVAYYKRAQRRTFLGSRSKPLGTGRRGTADQRVEQNHSQGAGGQGPAAGPSGACGVVALTSSRF